MMIKQFIYYKINQITPIYWQLNQRNVRTIAGRFITPSSLVNSHQQTNEKFNQTQQQFTQLTKEKISFDYKDSNTLPSKFRALSEDADPEFIESFGHMQTVTFNLAPYADKSEVIQQLVKLGVDLSIVERDRDMTHFLLHANYERHIKGHIKWLVDFGIEPGELGSFITQYPRIFNETFEILEQRIDYLRSKKFTKNAIVKIIRKYPPFLKYSFVDIDAILGFIQKEYRLSGSQVRSMVFQFPQVVNLDPMDVRLKTFSLKEELGFSPKQIAQVVMTVPSLLAKDRREIVKIFDHLHNTGAVKEDVILKFPEVLDGKFDTIKCRLAYLRKLGKDQFDPTEPLFIPLTALSHVDDFIFAAKYANTSLKDYDLFLKHL